MLLSAGSRRSSILWLARRNIWHNNKPWRNKPHWARTECYRINSNIIQAPMFIFLTNGFRGSILASLTPYVTSSFRSHSLLTVIGIVSSSISAAVYIPMAKLLDIWGRAEGFLLMTCSSILGVILMATSRNLATYCAAQVRNLGMAVFLVPQY